MMDHIAYSYAFQAFSDIYCYRYTSQIARFMANSGQPKDDRLP